MQPNETSDDIVKIRGETSARFLAALQKRRMSPSGVARMIGVDVKTLTRIRDGESAKIDAAYISAIARRLIDGGDFVREVTGLSDVEKEKAADRANAVIDTYVTTDETNGYWYSPYGERHCIRGNLEQELREAVVLCGDDPRRHAISTLGGIIRAGREIDYDPAKVTNRAARACADHLREIFGSKQPLILAGKLFDCETAIRKIRDAAATNVAALENVRRPFITTRLSISEITNPLLARFAIEALANDAALADMALKHGYTDKCAIFRVEGTNVVSLWAGSGLAVKRSEVVGKNVLDREDLGYGKMLRDHILEACSEKLVYRSLDIPMNELRARYMRVAAAGKKEANGSQIVVTVIEKIGLTPYE